MSTTSSTALDASSALNSLLASQSAGSGSTSSLPTAADQNDRFLKLLVTQIQNQDPLNPMDNAQVTSQMAQISTVSGLDKLNQSIGQMSALMLQAQSLQGAALVGKSVLVDGKDLITDAGGQGSGGFDLGRDAASVVISVADADGKVVDTIDLGAQDAGRHSFDWQAPSGKAGRYSFTVSARNGEQKVSATTLSADRVASVYTDGKQLSVELERHGVVGYADVKAVF